MWLIYQAQSVSVVHLSHSQPLHRAKIARLTFTGSAGQRVSANATGSFGSVLELRYLQADGTQLVNNFSCGGSNFFEPQVLPESGSYTLVIDPNRHRDGELHGDTL